MPRGRKRTQPIRSTSSAVQGDRTRREAAQSVIPLPQTPAAPARPPSAAPPVSPSDLTPLDAPTQRPQEPITAGLPTGPGPGPEALGPMAAGMITQDADLMVLQQIFLANPNPKLGELIARLQAEVGISP